jgi:DNA invertase Pin-like site-specific DNA recombinase
MSIAVYVRVSKGRGQDTASQRGDLERWAAAQAEASEWYEDRATGKTMERPAFERLMQGVRSGQIRTVAVWRLDRLGRTAKGLTALFEELRDRGVNLVSLRDGLDLSTPAGRLMANVLASVAAYETEVRAERIHAGLEVARAEGRHLGRPKGTGKGVRTKVTPDREQLIHRLKAEGRGVSAIARVTGLSRPTIYSVLDDRSLTS